MHDKAFRRELASWMHPNRSDAAEGMRGYSFGMGDIASVAAPAVIRAFDLGARQAGKDRALVTGSPALAVLATADDSPAAWLSTGQALFHTLLEASDAGVSAAFLNQPIEITALRPRLAEAIGTDLRSQLLLRLGYGPDIRPSPRRPPEEVILPA